MALTTADLHTSLAYRLGESSSPNDSTTKAQRLDLKIMSRLMAILQLVVRL